MFVIGTAGHIDHGKSVLVHALTGIDPDRLPEEKERGMTTDLGFAWLELPSGREVGMVDVPGHERFIKNMLAGVGGIDLALLVVAANEGAMAQTKEHLAILDLLGVERGTVVITKKDLVDEEWLNLVILDLEELIKPTSLHQAPIIAVSALTGEGLPSLISAIDQLLSSAEPRKDLGRPRLPIDRVFTIAGSGTVVTGTLIDGSLSVGEEVEIVPPHLKSRLRGLQIHKSRVNVASPGSRVAANLTGIATSELRRGDVLAKPGCLSPTSTLSVRLRILPFVSHPIQHNATVSFHSNTSEVMAKVRLLDKEKSQPGEVVWAQLNLNKAVAVLKGDRFIIRSTQETLGGGEIVEIRARRHRRHDVNVMKNLEAKAEGTVEEVILASMEGRHLELDRLLVRSGVLAAEAEPAIATLIQEKKIVQIGKGKHSLLFTALDWQRFGKKAIALLDEYHRRFPLRPGMPKAEFCSRLKIAMHFFPSILQRLSAEGHLAEEDASVRLVSHQIQLTQDQQRKVDAFLRSLSQNPYASSSNITVDPDLLNLLNRRGQIVKVSDDVVFSASAYNEMVERIISYIKTRGAVTLAEVRDLLNISRKYTLALFEYLDEQKITRRVGDKRILFGKS